MTPSSTSKPSSKLYLWGTRTLYIGPIHEPIRFVQPASSLVISLDKPIKINLKASDKNLKSGSFLIPPDENFLADCGDSPVAICMLDPLRYDYAALQPRMMSSSGPVMLNIENEDAFIEAFKTLYVSHIPQEVAYQKLDALLKPHGKVTHTVDPRIVKVLGLIHEHVSDNVSVEFFAKEVGVSVPRLVQLFRQQVGAPIRRYRLWHRVFCFTAEIARSKNLAAGAHAAGFSDYAHFNRTFKKMMGMTPSSLLSQPNGIEIFTPNMSSVDDKD